MIKESMTVHEALCELKVLYKRVIDAMSRSMPVGTKEHSASMINGKPVADYIASAKAAHQSAIDLINRMVAIKCAVNKYNAEKHITVCGNDYTIAQAIWMMTHGMDYKQQLLADYSDYYKKAVKSISIANGLDLDRRAETAMNAILGAKDKVDPAVYLNGIQEYKEQHTTELVDPIGIEKVIKDLEEEISSFNAKIDSAIQVANATTVIDIEY